MPLHVENLEITDSHARAILGPLSLRMGAGQRFGLIGPSGSGKSLLARALFGDVPRSLRVRGTVRAFGTPILPKEGPTTVLGTRMTWVPQDAGAALHPFLTLAESLNLLPAIHHGESLSATTCRMRPLLDRLRLPSSSTFLARLPFELSGGQRQRVALLQALSIEPSLLVMDEPTSGLDERTREAWRSLLLDLHRERGLGWLWITHDLFEAEGLTDRLLVMDQGRLVEEAPTQELLERPDHASSRVLVQAARDLRG